MADKLTLCRIWQSLKIMHAAYISLFANALRRELGHSTLQRCILQ